MFVVCNFVLWGWMIVMVVVVNGKNYWCVVVIGFDVGLVCSMCLMLKVCGGVCFVYVVL